MIRTISPWSPLLLVKYVSECPYTTVHALTVEKNRPVYRTALLVL
jgi:hypothetical protein